MGLVKAGTVLIYPGLVLDVFELEHFDLEFGYSLSKEWAMSGPKIGVQTAAFGNIQFAENPYNCGHKINAIITGVNKGLKYNCMLAHVRITEEHLRRHPDLAHQMQIGKLYPAIRVTKDILPREEFILKTYGAGYWAAIKREKAGKIKKWPFLGLTKEHREFFEKLRHDDNHVRAVQLKKPIKR